MSIKGFWSDLSRKKHPSDGKWWLTPIIIPNGVHVHAHSDPVSDHLQCALCFRFSAKHKTQQEGSKRKHFEHPMNVHIVRKTTDTASHCQPAENVLTFADNTGGTTVFHLRVPTTIFGKWSSDELFWLNAWCTDTTIRSFDWVSMWRPNQPG